ncbi:MAG: HD-GYP domain-containing protein [Actinobacteria bacterium]|nr:HD-GYP domain-containing protein [Actinomycetota bacterium]
MAISLIIPKNVESYIFTKHIYITSNTLINTLYHHWELESFNAPFSEETKKELNEMIALLISQGEITKIRIFNVNRMILFSSNNDNNENKINNKDFSKALNGEITHKIIKIDPQDKSYLKRGANTTDSLQIYSPIYNPDSKVMGIFEIIINLADLKFEILKSRLIIISTVVLSSLLFYGLLFGIAKNASITIVKQTKQLISDFIDTTTALGKLIEMRDYYTGQHVKKLKDLATLIGERMKFNQKEIDDLRIASSLHDIGKIGIDDKILNKPSQLTEEEFTKIKRHPITGANAIRNIASLKSIYKTILYHHERFDGKGYPFGLKEENIPISARVLSVMDAFEAMTSDRPYRKAMPIERAISIIKNESGKQFDPEVVDVFVISLMESKKWWRDSESN